MQRLTHILSKLYSTKTEDQYLQYSCGLLLNGTLKSLDYNREIYEHPLSDCQWQELKIDSSVDKRNFMMTPLFAATQNGIFTLGSVQSQTQVTPSQQVLIFARRKFRNLSASSGTQGAGTVPPSVEEKESEAREIRRLKRRFVRPTGALKTHAFWAKIAAGRKSRARELQEYRSKARHNQVAMLRKYRNGDVRTNFINSYRPIISYFRSFPIFRSSFQSLSDHYRRLCRVMQQ